ncbi:uncharacterized protein LOC128200556 isoform X2 [Galleria mellonella]|uniref:Uncharacterized protein LOC128200556 isoform X2 n=1 Tax=Galleria mellonella TaxID=7137 RepID=A0ABM3MGA0_GALME|nr:uncharacterized protein LOC128200556 isoform X2 [Galleria mellonella]
MPKAGKINESLSRTDKRRGSKSKLTSQSDQNVKIVNSGDGPGRMSPRLRRNMERVERQTEQYFQALAESSKKWSGPSGMVGRKEQVERARELRQRQKWLVDFSAQVAYRLCDYIAKGQKEMLVSNRLRSIADVVLERVAEILGEPKPSRTHPGRLARFMIAISDRIAVWIENAVYRAEALEPKESGVIDEHIRLDDEKTFLC